MNLRHHVLMNAVDTTASTAAPAAPDASAATSAAPAAAPAAAVPPANDSLLAPLPTSPAGDGPAWLSKVPEKSRVMSADGKPDAEATLAKLGESYTNLEKLKGNQAPSTASDYSWTPPEDLKSLQFDDALSAGFRERAHKAGLSNEQYQFVMGEYVNLVPEMLNSALGADAAAAREELSKVWQSPAAFEANLTNASRAIAAAPDHLRQSLHSRFGRDAEFLQFAAAMGQGMREDSTPPNPDGSGGQQTAEQLMAHPAYRDPRHPEHAAISKRVMEAHQRANPG